MGVVRTEAGDSGECDIHINRDFLASALVYNDWGVGVNFSVVQKLERGETEDNCNRNEGY